MDEISRKFDEWAISGGAERMEAEHGATVTRFLWGCGLSSDSGEQAGKGVLAAPDSRRAKLRRPFSFLDVGCGNGWVVRRIAAMGECKAAVGIDTSPGMVMRARSMSKSRKETFLHADIEMWRTSRRFDYAFSMESLYYAESVERALRSIHRILKPGGRFFCGTDFYSENASTASWKDDMGVRMRLCSRGQWRSLFRGAGFAVSTRLVRDPDDSKQWKRDIGTLFITGIKEAA